MFLLLIVQFKKKYCFFCGPGSSVGIATRYGLDGPVFESRWGSRFSATVHTGPGTHTAFLYNGYQVFPGGKERPGRDADPSPLLVPWSRKSRAIPLLPLWVVRAVQRLSACTEPQCLYSDSVPVQ